MKKYCFAVRVNGLKELICEEGFIIISSDQEQFRSLNVSNCLKFFGYLSTLIIQIAKISMMASFLIRTCAKCQAYDRVKSFQNDLLTQRKQFYIIHS